MNKKAICISGCSSGIGKSLALNLAKQGFCIFAGVRKEEDRQSLLAYQEENLIPIIFDVTQKDSIASACHLITDKVGERGLYALINNAGISHFAPSTYLDENSIRELFDVNYFGMVEMTKAFFPLLKKAQGRVMNISSPLVMAPTPLFSHYSASKAALEAFSETFRIESRSSGIRVMIVRPNRIRSKIAKYDPRQCHDEIDDWKMGLHEGLSMLHEKSTSFDKYTKKIAKILRAHKPKKVYTIGKDVGLMFLVQRLLPSRIIEHFTFKFFKLQNFNLK